MSGVDEAGVCQTFADVREGGLDSVVRGCWRAERLVYQACLGRLYRASYAGPCSGEDTAGGVLSFAPTWRYLVDSEEHLSQIRASALKLAESVHGRARMWTCETGKVT
jgi:hypothetical protein